MTDELKQLALSENESLITEIRKDGHEPILLGLGGSYAYGTNVEGSDIDVRGIYTNSKSELLGVEKDSEQYVSTEVDTTVYSLKKAALLLKECNPAMIELLGCRKEDYLYMTEYGQMLIDNIDVFLSKKAIKTFGGYAKSQLNRLINRSGRSRDMLVDNEERSFEKAFLSLQSRYKHYIPGTASIKQEDNNLFLSFSVQNMPVNEVANILNEFNSIDRGYRKSVRNDKAATHNKLAKHMMHLIRLYMMGIEVLSNHYVRTYRDGSEHELLMSIRNGDYLEEDGLTPKPEFEKLVENYSRMYESACESTTLPDNPDMNKINKLVIEINETFL